VLGFDVQENYFFRLSKYSEEVKRFVATPGAVLPARAANEVRQWTSDGCRDFSITRAAVDWGIRVPRDDAQTVYVWFDALIGYLSALLPDSVEPSADNLMAHGWPADVHIIGKDILRFHAVYWPGMLMSMGLPLPKKVFGHGFLRKDGMKMGKSLGNVLDPFRLTEAYGSDAVRCTPLLQPQTAPQVAQPLCIDAALSDGHGWHVMHVCHA
jgi:methionyl-tRNA synthetase